jgi:hypothetical protein
MNAYAYYSPERRTYVVSSDLLRDQFAMHALQGLLSAHIHPNSMSPLDALGGERGGERAEWFAQVAYRLADAMMEEREK